MLRFRNSILFMLCFAAFFLVSAFSHFLQGSVPPSPTPKDSAQELSASSRPNIVRMEIRGPINPATAVYFQRAVEFSEENKAELLLVELDTPGGLVSTTREIAQSVDRSKVPVVFFVSPAGAAATSAGALLMISSHLAAMAPGTNIGAAHPVGGQGEDIPGDLGKKAVEDVAAFARGLAELRGRNPKVAGEVVTKSKSYSSEEALKVKLIEVIAPSRDELFNAIRGRTVQLGEQRVSFDIPNDLKEINLIEVEMRPGEKLLNVLAHPNIAAILMTLGLLLIYAEISAPGIGVAGIAGGLCLLIAFIGLQALPVQAGGLALLALGAALLIAELFVVSGGALAVGGLVSFVLGLLWLFDPGAGDLQISTSVLVFSIGTIAVGVGLLIWAASRTRSLQRKTLETTGGGELSGLKGYVGRVDSVDSSGHAGLILIRGEIWKFTSEKPVQQGDSVQVVEVHGLSVKIEKQEA